MSKIKLKQCAFVTLAISVSSLISFNMFTEGFIVAMSPLVMGICIYCYIDIPGRQIAWIAAIFSPLFRLISLSLADGFSTELFLKVLPDTMFFLMYGLVFELVGRYIVKEKWSEYEFFIAILLCDFSGNICEMLCRSFIAGRLMISINTLVAFALIAVIRTSIMQVVIVAIEAYTKFILDKEKNEMFEKLLTQASVFETELRLMEKNVNEIESIMKKAYVLHQADTKDISPEVKCKLLDIAKNAHEVKGDYLNVINTLKNVYVNEIGAEKMLLSEILRLEKQNLMAAARTNGYTVSVSIKLKKDYSITNPFKMMSVIRNIFTNSFEAFKKNEGRIMVSVEETREEIKGKDSTGKDTDVCSISIRDNGCGIDEEMLNFVTMEGYSTKFNSKTGNIQRGLGLSIVKEIVEDDYGGSFNIKSTVNKGTEVIIKIPGEKLGVNL